MPSLVLDKSVVVAARNGVLAALRARGFSFILTDTLLYEISSERLEERRAPCESGARGLDGRIAACLARAREAGDEWAEMSQALRWEVLHGKSAKYAPRLLMKPSFSLQDILDARKEVGDECLDQEAVMGRIASVAREPQDDTEFSKMRRMDKRSFLHYLQGYVSSRDLLEAVSIQARVAFAEVAANHGLKASPCFVPDRGWLAYGVELVNRAYVRWKFWRVGDQVADPRKPANPFFDLLYIAFMAIGDGIISCDEDLLTLSWACWAEKRQHILRFDSASGSPRQFQPDCL